MRTQLRIIHCLICDITEYISHNTNSNTIVNNNCSICTAGSLGLNTDCNSNLVANGTVTWINVWGYYLNSASDSNFITNNLCMNCSTEIFVNGHTLLLILLQTIFASMELTKAFSWSILVNSNTLSNNPCLTKSGGTGMDIYLNYNCNSNDLTNNFATTMYMEYISAIHVL